MEISSLRQSAANGQLSLASPRFSIRRVESLRGLPRLKLRSTAAKLDSSKSSEGCIGDGGSLRLKFGVGGMDSRIQEASVLRRRVPDGRAGSWSASAGNEVGSTVDESASRGVLLMVQYFLRSQSFE